MHDNDTHFDTDEPTPAVATASNFLRSTILAKMHIKMVLELLLSS